MSKPCLHMSGEGDKRFDDRKCEYQKSKQEGNSTAMLTSSNAVIVVVIIIIGSGL